MLIVSVVKSIPGLKVVAVNRVYSFLAIVLRGVPQGTVLRPILYTNDLRKCVSNSCLESFADDSKLIEGISCMDDTALLQRDLVNVSQWSQENSMVLQSPRQKV